MHFIRQTYNKMRAPLEIQTDTRQTELLNRTRNSHRQQLQRQTDQLINDQRQGQGHKNTLASILNCCGLWLGCMKMTTPCICSCIPSPVYQQPNSEFGLLQNLGKFSRVLKPGLNIINPVTERVVVCSRKTQMLDIIQPIITRDNVSCVVQTVVYFRVSDPVPALYKLGSQNISNAVRQIGLAAIRAISGQNLFQNLISNRNVISKQLHRFANLNLSRWGIYAQQIFLKDIRLDKDTQQYLSMATQTKRQKAASLIAAQSLAQTAKLYANVSVELNTPAAMQIRYLQLLSQMSQLPNQKLLMVKMEQFSSRSAS